MRINTIWINSYSNERGNASYDCTIIPEGMQNFNAVLSYSHLSNYLLSGVKIVYRVLQNGLWSELPFVDEVIRDSNVNEFLKK